MPFVPSPAPPNKRLKPGGFSVILSVSQQGTVGRLYDVLSVWRERASNVSGKGLLGGHNLQYDLPEETLAELRVVV